RKILFSSDALMKMLGLTVADIDEGRFRRFVHPDDIAETAKLVEAPAPGKISVATYRMRHKDGHYVWIETTIRTVFNDKTGEAENVISVSRDVTERKNQELDMQAAREHAEAANK